MSIEFEPSSSFDLKIRGLEVRYNHTDEIFVFGESKLKAPAINGKVKLRILLDRASIELFANEGASVSTNYVVPEANNQRISISSDGKFKIYSLIVNELKSSW
jgi:fructan beta-fructosidase